MINKTYSFSFEGIAPFTYTVSLLSSNIAVDKLTGTTSDKILSLEFTFKDEEALNNANATLLLVDSNQCEIEIPINFSTISCIEVGEITFQQLNSILSFVVPVSGGSGNYEYGWIFDTAIFQTNSSTNSQLDLTPINTIPDEFTVSVIVKDKVDGCSALRTLTVNPCKPQANNVAITLQILNTSTTCSQAKVLLDVTSCTENIDWSTLNVNNSTPLTWTNNNDGTINIFAPFDPKKTIKNYTLTYEVSDVTGVKSNIASIFVKVPACVIAKVTPIAEDKSTLISTTPIVGDKILIPLADRVSPSEDVNWGSIEVVQTPLFGTTQVISDRTIEYEVTTVPTGPDTVKWRVKNNLEEWSNIVTDTLDFRPLAAPILAPQTVLIRSGEELDVNFILGATGVISPSSLELVSVDAKVTVVGNGTTRKVKVASDNTVVNRAINYKVATPEGKQSASVAVSIKSVNSGQPREQTVDLTCLQGNIDLLVYLQYESAFGSYVFTETTSGSPTYTSQGGTMTGTHDSIINLDSILPGTYEFTNTAFVGLAPFASETMTSVITVVKNAVDTVPNDNSAGAIDVPYPPLQYSLVDYNNNNCPVRKGATISATPTPSGWTTPYNSDMWYKFTVTSSTNLSPYFYLQVNGLGTRLALYNNSLTELFSVTGSSDLATILPANYSAPLTLGNTYYLRVGTVTAGQFNLIISKNAL